MGALLALVEPSVLVRNEQEITFLASGAGFKLDHPISSFAVAFQTAGGLLFLNSMMKRPCEGDGGVP